MPAAIQIARDVWRVPTVPFDLINSFLIRAEDPAIRANRLALLKRLADRFGAVAAIGHLSA